LENWFHSDEVSKDCAKRRELRDIILARMKERGSVLPLGFKFPVLDFTPSPTLKTHPYDVSNSTNRQSSSNPSHLSNRFHPNAAHNSPKPSTSQNQPKHPNPSLKYPNHLNRNNSGYHNNHQYYDDHHEDSDEETTESIDDEDVNRQFNENDHYDEDFREPYEEDEEEYDDDEAIIQERAEYLAEMVESPDHVDDEEEEDLE